TYNLGYNGKYFIVFIWDTDAKTFASGTASSADMCMSLSGTQYADSASCELAPASSTGSVTVTFNLQFNAAKTYQLEANAGIEDASTNVLALTNDSGSSTCALQFCGTFQPFDITVSNQLQLAVETNSP